MSDPEAVDRMYKKISQLTRVIYLLNTKKYEEDKKNTKKNSEFNSSSNSFIFYSYVY